MERKWQDLDVKNLPSDILAEGSWELQYHHGVECARLF